MISINIEHKAPFGSHIDRITDPKMYYDLAFQRAVLNVHLGIDDYNKCRASIDYLVLLKYWRRLK